MEQFRQDFSIVYICENCKRASSPPIHCGQPMQIQVIQGENTWVCCKGEHPPCCGKTSVLAIDNCCNDPLLVLEPRKVLI